MAFFWSDVALWYQYDSTNPKNPPNHADAIATNYRNYFLCSDIGVKVRPVDLQINLSVKLRNCYKVLFQSLTDWSNWTKIGPKSDYFGILDYCKNSDSESVTLFQYKPISSDLDFIFWGNSDNGNPQLDWDDTTGATTQYKFNSCWHINGNKYELNNGGK